MECGHCMEWLPITILFNEETETQRVSTLLWGPQIYEQQSCYWCGPMRTYSSHFTRLVHDGKEMPWKSLWAKKRAWQILSMLPALWVCMLGHTVYPTLRILALGASLVAQLFKKKKKERKKKLACQCRRQIRSLIREDPTCCRATKPVRHNYWAGAPEPGSCNCRTHVP